MSEELARQEQEKAKFVELLRQHPPAQRKEQTRVRNVRNVLSVRFVYGYV